MKWIVIFINSDDPHYRLFMTTGGSFLYGDNWRMNSGITKVEQDGDELAFHGSSGSVYRVHKEGYGTTVYGSGILNDFINRSEDKAEITIMPEETNWLEVDWIIS